jgi:hypothetical protein
MSPSTTSLAAFGCVVAGMLLGMLGQFLLPEHHRSPETREVVRLGMGLVGTTVALVLGLLIASGKGFYDTQNSEITEVAANVVLLDRVLAHYGPETKEARGLLRGSIAHLLDVTGRRTEMDTLRSNPTALGGEALFDKLQDLSPQNDRQRLLQNQALNLAIKLGQTRWLLFAQKTSSVPMPLLAIMVFWLVLLFMSFGLFVRPNVTVVSSLLISALAVCGAIFLILEMYEPYTGLIRVSTASLQAAFAQLGQ